VSWQWPDVRHVQSSCRATFSSTKTTLKLGVTSRREWLAPHRLTMLFHAGLNLQINLVRQSFYIAGNGRAAAGGAAPGPAGGGPRHHQGHRRAGRPAPARGGGQAEEPTHSHGHPPRLPHGQVMPW
jgi:hypothetical protein